MLSFMQFGQIPFSFFVPVAAARMKNQRLLVAVIVLFYFLGLSGMLVGTGNQAATAVSVLLFGIANGSSFSLVMVLLSLRTRTGEEASALSGMAQSVGYAIAAIGPVLFGFVHDASGSWLTPMIIPAVAIILFLVAGMEAGKDLFLHSET